MVRPFDEKLEQELQFFERQLCQILDAAIFPHEHRMRSRAWCPPTDIYETDSAVIIKAEIAGMSANDFNISFVDRILTIQGIRKDMEAKLHYHCLDIPYGKFQLRVLIPGSYIEAEVKARYENGYLYVVLPKACEQQHNIATPSESG